MHTGASPNTPFLSRLRSYNPFGEGGYVQLPTHNEGPGAPLPAATRREEEEGFFACEFFSPLSCDPPILRSYRTPLCDPGDETAVPAPGGLLPCLFLWLQADRREKHTNTDCV